MFIKLIHKAQYFYASKDLSLKKLKVASPLMRWEVLPYILELAPHRLCPFESQTRMLAHLKAKFVNMYLIVKFEDLTISRLD